MAEIAAFAIDLGVPVIGQLDLRALVARRGEEDQRVATLLVLDAANLLEAELVAVEVERFVDIRDADHGVKVFHRRQASRGSMIPAGRETIPAAG